MVKLYLNSLRSESALVTHVGVQLKVEVKVKVTERDKT